MISKIREVLAFIPARERSKRIMGKNLKLFAGKPLLQYTVEQSLSSPRINRTIVCTESKKIAALAKKVGAEVPFLRPQHLAADKSDVIHSIFYFLNRLQKEENYQPTHLVILQATSPLRELNDIDDCFRLLKKTGATTVLTVAPTHPKLYHLDTNHNTVLVNGNEAKTSLTQAWPKAYLLNGCVVYVVDVKALCREKRIITRHTKAVVMPKWRSIDLDEPEEWAMAEVIFKNRDRIKKIIKKIGDEKSS